MKKLSKILFIVGVLAFSFITLIHKADANPFFFERFQSASATSTVVYMQPGTASTTVTALNNQNASFESAIVNIQVIATTTGVSIPVINARVEGSMDNQDWYPVALYPSVIATSTALLTPYSSLSLQISTSTSPAGNFGGSGTATQIMSSFTIPVSIRHLRVVFTDPAGGGKYGLWAEIVTKRQTN